MHPAKLKSIERQDRILESLKRFGYLTRKQVQELHGIKGERNARRVLQGMEQYLNSFYTNQKIYYLNKEGRERVKCDKVRTKLSTVDHYIMRNDLYIHLGTPAGWLNEVRISYIYEKNNPKSRKIIVVADALFKRGGRYHIVEVDNTQKMKTNKAKIEKYRRLIEKNVFGGMPKLIWFTITPYRAREIKELCDGLDVDVFIVSDFY